MKVFVIGATGYIGGVVAEKLMQAGHAVVGLARTSEAVDRLRRKGMDPFLGTLDHPEGLLPVLASVDAVVDTAYKYDDVEDVKREIATGRSHLTEILAALSGSGKTFVFTSGTGVLRDTGDLVYDEDTPLPPTDQPVTIARRAIEQEVMAAEKNGVRTIVLRPPVVYGRGGSLIIPRMLLEHAKKSGESIYIDGTENNKWSVVHVDDLADLYLLAIEKAPAGSLWHTTAESGITTRSIAEAISRAAGLNGKTKSATLEEARSKLGDWADFWALNNQSSGARAISVLGWTPSRPAILDDIQSGSYREATTSAP